MKKTTIKLVLFVCVFSSVAFADGDMGNGSKTCPPNTTCLVAIQPVENDSTVKDTAKTEADDSILTLVQKYLFSIFE